MTGSYRRPWYGPLGELTWHVSLDLYEALTLGRHRWWWRLHSLLRQEFRSVDPGRLARAAQGRRPESLAYGETPASSVARILRLAQVGPQDLLVDLGSGRGLAVLAACCLGCRAEGLEYFGELVEGASAVADRLGVEAEFVQGDFLAVDLPPAEVYYAASTAFGDATRGALEEKLAGCPPGTRVVTLDWLLGEDRFERVASAYVPVTWGVALACLHRVRSPLGGGRGGP